MSEEFEIPPTAVRSQGLICETCAKLNFGELLENPQEETDHWGFGPWNFGVPSPYIMRYNKDCSFCRIMFRGISSPDPKEMYELRSYSFKTIARCNSEQSNQDRDSILLKIGGQQADYFPRLPEEEVFCYHAKDTFEQGPFFAQPVQHIWDPVKAKSWLTTCAVWHDSTCNQQEFPEILGMNLIDCERMVIVVADSTMRWVALSYVWGATYQHSTSSNTGYAGFRKGSHIPPDIPRTVLDAIKVTLQLGYRYLWVDEYCIDQTNDDHLHSQITKMDHIYHAADLTIVAAAGEHKGYGLPGVEGVAGAGPTKRIRSQVISIGDYVIFSNGIRPDRLARRSKWYTRAWTLQEGMLSRRLLVFTDHQTSFYCLASSWTETHGDPSLSTKSRTLNDWQSWAFFGYLAQLPTPEWNWNHFADLVEMLSERYVSNEVDILASFLGVISYIRRWRPNTCTLCGLPYCFANDPSSVPVIDSLESLVTAALSWKLSTTSVVDNRRRSVFPSWTWAGWTGGASFWRRQVDNRRHRFFVRKVTLEPSSTQQSTSGNSDKKSMSQMDLDTVTII